MQACQNKFKLQQEDSGMRKLLYDNESETFEKIGQLWHIHHWLGNFVNEFGKYFLGMI